MEFSFPLDLMCCKICLTQHMMSISITYRHRETNKATICIKRKNLTHHIELCSQFGRFIFRLLDEFMQKLGCFQLNILRISHLTWYPKTQCKRTQETEKHNSASGLFLLFIKNQREPALAMGSRSATSVLTENSSEPNEPEFYIYKPNLYFIVLS